ncbi:MAG TPA: SH3 domain-containing protein [Streptosporangiaceae bacterium]
MSGTVAAALVLASSSASAAPAPHRHHQASRTMKTLFASVRVFTSASGRGALSGTVRGTGTAVSVLCWTTGTYYKDTPIWYEISAPTAGYVSAFSMNAHYAPAVGVPHCLSPAFREQFNALETSLRIRSAPSTGAPITGYLGPVGSRVKIDCYVKGTTVYQDPIWYHTIAPQTGYVSGRLLNTGADPAPGVPRC